MNFTSFEYAGFLAATVALNWALPRRLRPALLLVASYVFYATWSVSAISILVVVTLAAYGAALLMPRLEGTARTALTTAAVVVAASPLVVFKVVEGFGLSGDDSLPGVTAKFAVPVGLSFFSFQAISYLIDVHRREIRPSRSVVDVALFLAFFPHLLAGPIVRAKKLIPAFHGTERWPDGVRTQEATELILVGVFKKVALADPVFRLTADAVLKPDKAGTVNALLSLVMVLVAGYFDVTGYIDIARGSAKLLGIDMQRNALLPLTKSTGYADFWRRWQLTVMMWFRDYVYKPLRGDGKQPIRDHLALFGTFFVLGVWHGLTVGWALWGVASGVIIIVERSLQTRRAARRRAQTRAARKARDRSLLPRKPSAAASLAIALVLVVVTFPLVAATSLHDTGEVYRSLVVPHGAPTNWDLLWFGVISIVALIVLDRRETRREAKTGRRDPITLPRALAFGFMVVAVIVFSGPTPQTFVYFTF